MNYISVCSGIEAASVAWHPLGWNCLGVSEIEPFPSAVLAHHYPNVPNFGDMTKFKEWKINGTVDLLVGGTPCQSFSVAGLRQGLKDPRGNLMLTYLAIAEHLRPRYIVWENVPGVLSSNGGKDFGSFLGGLGELGYGWAYRVLDAQWCRTHRHPRAVPQRRRRVFVVGCLGNPTSAAKVLFESESMQRYSAPRRATRERTAADVAGCLRSGGDGGVPSSRGEHLVADVATIGALCARDPCPTLDRSAVPAVEIQGTVIGRQDHNGPQGSGHSDSGEMFTLNSTDVHAVEVAPTITATNDPSRSPQSSEITQQVAAVHLATMQVRRLTPTECERLQGFPDDWTAIPWKKKPADQCPDGPRYKALGNSMAVNCMEWLGERIQAVESGTL